jgi:hypothetical protein
MASFLLSVYEKAMAKHSAIVKKRDEVQRGIELAQEAMQKDIEADKTVTYYRSELKRHQDRHDAFIRALEDKLEAAKRALEDKHEAAKRASESSYDSEKTRLEDLLSGKIQKIEQSEPDTPAYRKMKAEKKKLEAEEEKANEEMIDASHTWQELEAKKAQERIREAELKEKQYHLKKQREEEAARQEIEARKEREAQEAQRKFDEALARAGPRVVVEQPPMTQDEHNKFTMEALKNAFPAPRKFKKGKKTDLADLNRHTLYSVADLSTVELHSDDENNPDPQLALYEELWHEACVREKVPGSYEN